MSKVTNVDLDDDAVSDDEVLTSAAKNGDVTMEPTVPAENGTQPASDLRVELTATDEPVVPLLVEAADAHPDGIIQNPMEIDADDEVLNIGEVDDPWMDPEFAEQDARMNKAFGIDSSDGDRMHGDRMREATALAVHGA